MLEMLLQMMVVTMKIGALVPCRRHDAVGDRRGTQICLHTLALVTPEKAFTFRGKDCQWRFLPRGGVLHGAFESDYGVIPCTTAPATNLNKALTWSWVRACFGRP